MNLFVFDFKTPHLPYVANTLEHVTFGLFVWILHGRMLHFLKQLLLYLLKINCRYLMIMRFTLRCFLFTLLCILIPAPAFAQRMRIYSSDEDLSSSLVNKIMQDSRGFIWIATENGLNQFDGTRFKKFYKGRTNSRSLPDNYIHTVYESTDSTLFVGCINGLVVYNRGEDTFSEIPMLYRGERVTPHVTDMTELSTGHMLIATAGRGLFIYKKKENTATSLDSVTNLVGDLFISTIFEDSTHAVWIGTETKRVCRYYPSSGKVQAFRAPFISGNFVTSFLEEDDHDVLVGTIDGGIDRYDRRTESFTALTVDGGNKVAVKTLGRIDGVVFAGTDGKGLWQVSGNNLTESLCPVSVAVGTGSIKVHQIMSDRDGNLWLGIFQKGVAFIPRNKYKFSYIGTLDAAVNPIGRECVMSIFADRDNCLWVSCDNSGLYCLDKNLKLQQHYPLPYTTMCMMRDSRGKLWSGTYAGGAFIFDGGQWSRIEQLRDRKICSLAEAKNGLVFVGSLDRGLECYNPTTTQLSDCMTYLRQNNSANDNRTLNAVNALLISSDGLLWVAHYNGICCYNPDTRSFRLFSGGLNMLSNCVGHALLEDSNKSLWFGTSDGLYRYNPQTSDILHISTDNGLPNDVICGISEGDDGNIWVSTYQGICRISPDASSCTNFDFNDGLQGNEFTRGAYFRDDEGIIYFGGTRGITYFHPLDITEPASASTPFITEVGVLGPRTSGANGDNSLSDDYRVVLANCDNNASIRLPANDNTVKIFFSTVSYNNPAKIRYEYRLKDKEKWMLTEPGQGMVTFYNLGPGSYDFEIRVAGSNDTPALLKIIIDHPWYASWWMKLIYLVAIAVIVFMFYRYHIQRKEAQTEIAKRRQAEEVAEAKLQLFTSFSHEIRTPMTLIIDPMYKLMNSCTDKNLLTKYTLIYRNATRVMGLVNQLMDLRKFDRGQMRLQARETDLAGFIRDVMQPFGQYASEHNISLTFKPEEERMMGYLDLQLFDKVMMNLLSNAFKCTPDGGHINITLTVGSDSASAGPLRNYYEIRVSDSGCGIPEADMERVFERFFQANRANASGILGTGIGLHLVRQIVTLHHGVIHAENRQDTTGAIFIIRIPRGSAHLKDSELIRSVQPSRQVKNDEFSLPKINWEDYSENNSGRRNEVIVIAEDDEENRNYLRKALEERYRNVTAFASADEAYKAIIAMKPGPDLIISDIIMDGMDGITFTRRLKHNANTNHTPVILMTGQSEPEDMKKAIESGADQLIIKPFSSELLLATIHNILVNRHILQVKFSGNQACDDKVEKISLKSADDMLMRRVMEVVNKNIASPDFSVEKLAEAVGLSRAHLHRKLKELTNLSARDFIRNIRMRQAARLLSEKNLSISDVAYATGFANTSHFSSVFKEFFGMTPSQYTADRHSEESV